MPEGVEKKLIVTDGQKSLIARPRDLGEAMKLAEAMAKSDLVPKDMQGKPHSVLIAIGLGDSLGLNPFQAIQGIAVINNRPCIFGDTAKGIAMASPDFEWIKERSLHEVQEKEEGLCIVKRKGQEPIEVRFSRAAAEKAKLWGKTGRDGQATPWITYPYRMLQMRARLFAMRDCFPDAFKGISMAEEVADHTHVVEATVDPIAGEAEVMPKRTDQAPAGPRREELKPETAKAPEPKKEPETTKPDPENATPEARPTISAEQAKDLVVIADEHGVTAEVLIEHMAKTYGIDFPYELPADKFQAVKEWAERGGK